MKRFITLFGVCAMMLSCSTDNLQLISPNGANTIAFEVDDAGAVTYTVGRDGKQIVNPSPMGYELKGGISLSNGFEVIGSSTSSKNDSWKSIWGQREDVANNYKELTINLKQGNTGVLMNLIARAFDDGVAFRYEFPEQDKLDEFVIMDELTGFNMAQDYETWWGYGDYDNYEKIYNTTPLSDMGDPAKFPHTPRKKELDYTATTPMAMRVDEGVLLTLHEAHLYDYADMMLQRDGLNLKACLVPWMNGDLVRTKTPMQSPWRTFQIGTDAEVAESDMLMNLNPPMALEDISWIEPFKYIGIWWEMHIGKSSWAVKTQFGKPVKLPHGANTENAKRHIDFAAKYGIEQVLIEGWDTGWDKMVDVWRGYGIFDWKTPTEDFDIDEVYSYAKQKGVKIMVYFETISDAAHFDPIMDDRFEYFSGLGANSIKIGYTGEVNYDSVAKKGREYRHGQYMVRHYNNMVKTAAKHGMMVINHEPIKYTGEQRTYPNLMAREGARGQEYNAWGTGNPLDQGVIMPFTRLVAGPIDYTPGIFKMKVESRKNQAVKTTVCRELAYFLTMYSPIQMAADLPENYEGNPAFQFILDVPVDWSDSKVLHAKIGDYYTVARREKGTDNWYIGSVTDESERALELDLSQILKPNTKYKATIYADAPDTHWQTNPESFEITTREVTASDIISMRLAEGGGQAISIVEVK